ncbi:hypothetical protein F444_09325 [Phytophthora nicotianae P1976]|uniref:Uncharacterized protein n=1 Tax=Phytophthora nicotianae P1976 TaxID=1317066 RepID=A0A081A822_PHYNI|nr:hypothetical protein F444_09325 [Phytophthora nicotianae P1976]
MRKGAATYCASGSTACPSSTSVHLRAGWSLGGVQNTYLRYESAGDMHAGRTVSGLPPDSHEFAHLTLLSDLLTKLRGVKDRSGRLHATGVPPHVAILGKMKGLLEGTLQTVEHIDAARASTVKEIMSELEKRAIGAETVTFEGLDLALKRCLDTVGVMDLVNKLNTTPEQTTCQLVEGETPVIPSFFWGGRFRRVPQEF